MTWTYLMVGESWKYISWHTEHLFIVLIQLQNICDGGQSIYVSLITANDVLHHKCCICGVFLGRKKKECCVCKVSAGPEHIWWWLHLKIHFATELTFLYWSITITQHSWWLTFVLCLYSCCSGCPASQMLIISLNQIILNAFYNISYWTWISSA